MAVRLFTHRVADLCLGKPALRALPLSATVADALFALKKSGEIFLSVWNCDHLPEYETEGCRCIGKVCMVDVLCFLSERDNLLSPFTALQSPLSVLLTGPPSLVLHVQSNASVLEAIDMILDGAQNLVVPIENRINAIRYNPTNHTRREFCWLSQEDVIRYLLNSISQFSPTQALSIQTLDIMEAEVFSIRFDEAASSVLPLIVKSQKQQTAVAVLDDDGSLMGEISYLLLAGCDETVVGAIATLSGGELLAFIDGGDPSDGLVGLVKARLEERDMGAVIDLIDEDGFSTSSVSSSSDDEYGVFKLFKTGRVLNRRSRRSETVCCCPHSSLVAVMLQALAHRVNYVWVVKEEDCNLVGVVTFSGMLSALREHVRATEML